MMKKTVQLKSITHISVVENNDSIPVEGCLESKSSFSLSVL